MKGNPKSEGGHAASGPTPTPPPVACDAQGYTSPAFDRVPPAVPSSPPPWEAGGPPGSWTPPPGSWMPPPPMPLPPLAVQGGRAPRRAPARLLLWAALLLSLAGAFVFAVSRAVVAVSPAATAAWRAAAPMSRALILAEQSARTGAGADVLVAPQVFSRWVGSTPPLSIRHEGYASIRGGVLFTPDTFKPTGSSYDLVVHFHGNTQLVRESAEVAGLNAAVAVINLGIGSGPYEDAYAQPGMYEALLADIERALAQRGLPSPRLRRVALSSWSAGYGAVSKILELHRSIDTLDAILVTDGIHCGFLPEGPDGLNHLQLAAFARSAQLAAAGEILFTITHSEIDPITYASSTATANYLLDVATERSVERVPSREAPPHLQLRAAEGAVSKKLEKHMVPTTEAAVGSFHIRGFRGNTPEHHMAHLLQSAATVFPELAERWRTGGDSPPSTR
jgi:hypothetical protein